MQIELKRHFVVVIVRCVLRARFSVIIKLMPKIDSTAIANQVQIAVNRINFLSLSTLDLIASHTKNRLSISLFPLNRLII